MNKKDAIIVESDKRCEVRCADCGKLLFTFQKTVDKSVETVDKTAQCVTIVARCTRSSCRTDNLIVF